MNDRLSRLERSARGCLGRAGAEAAVAEAREGLAESIAARLELGDSPETAQEGALRAADLPSAFLRPRLRAHRARFRPLFLGGALASGAGLGAALASAGTMGLEPALGALTALAVCLGSVAAGAPAIGPREGATR